MISVQTAIRYDNPAEFEAASNDSLEWLLLGESSESAAHLILTSFVASHRCSEIEFSHIYLFAHFFRHAAQALEGWAKGIISCRRPLVRRDFEHDLTSLFAECGVTPARSALLKRLEHYLKWAGRYPTPRNPGIARSNPIFLCHYRDVLPTLKLMENTKAALIHERKKRKIRGKGLFYAHPNEEEVCEWDQFLQKKRV